MTQKTNWLRVASSPLKALTALLCWLAMNVAFAQQAAPSTDQYLSATGPDDASVKVFKHLVGDFFTNPMSFAGGADSLLGQLFLVFNGFVFVIAMVWMSYGIVFKVVSTASAGEVMGSKMSAAWMPVRYLTGVAGIVPIFGGYSMSQALLVTVALLGIGVTNFATNKALDASAQFQSLVRPNLAGVAASEGMNEMTKAIFEGYVCQAAMASQDNQLTMLGIPLNTMEGMGERDPTSDAVAAGVMIGSEFNNTMCGVGMVKIGDATDVRENGLFEGAFRTNSVNYTAIAERARTTYKAAHAQVFPVYKAKIQTEAYNWFRGWVASRSTEGGLRPPVNLTKLAEISQSYQVELTKAAETIESQTKGSSSALTAEALREMKRYGWFGLGAWFSTFAEINAAVADATKIFEMYGSGPLTVKLANSETRNALSDLSTEFDNAQEQRSSSSGFCDALGMTTPTGNCSLGQAIMKKVISGVAADSGGDGLVNPIIMFKNLGDWTMTIGGGVLTYAATADKDGGGAKGDAGQQAAPPPGGEGKSWVGKKISNLFDSIKSLAPTIAALMLFLGAFMALYIPLIPFITWMGAIIQYVVVVIEGLVGMPIAALSHMDSDGEGMGQRTERGYIFLLNVAFRPILMVLGFFAASALVIVLGTFQTELFIPAIANVQGNSVTGLFSIIGFLVIFAVMNVTLIQGMFNMIFLLPDQVLGLIGAGSTDSIGKDTENKVNQLYMASARVGQGMADKAFMKKPSEDGMPRKGKDDNQDDKQRASKADKG